MISETSHRFLCANSKNLHEIKNQSVQLIITSPPYPMVQMWDEILKSQNPKIQKAIDSKQYQLAFNEMHAVLNQTWSECDRVLQNGGFICINIGDATRTFNDNFQLFSNHTKIIDFFAQKGYSVLPDIHWRKPSNSPNKFMGSGMYPAGAYVTYEHEYILIFRKGGKRVFNNQSRSMRQASAYFWEERNVWFSDLWEIKGTKQAFAVKNTRARNASFPFEIPFRLIAMYSVYGDTVLDPFCGCGTTNLAAITLGRNSIGVDIDQQFINFAKEQATQSLNQLNQKIHDRLSTHQNFINSLSEESRTKCYKNNNLNVPVKTKQEQKIQIPLINKISQSDDLISVSYCD